MGYNFKETMNKPERFAPGHRMCAGCGATICARNVLRGLHEGDKAVIGCATGQMCIRDRFRQYCKQHCCETDATADYVGDWLRNENTLWTKLHHKRKYVS